MRTYLFIILFFITLFCKSQELNCRISVVNTSPNQNVDAQVFKSLENSLNEFVNNRKWTADQFKSKEKIDCNILINVTKEINNQQFEATATIQSSRPVFNTNYNSVLLNIQDKYFNFSYEEHQALLYNENSFINNLTSLLAFYSYIIIGFDYDSYGLKGGDKAFSKAQDILNNAQSSGFSGWKIDPNSPSTRNRNMLIDNILHVDFEAFRDCMYRYHRQGMDQAYSDIKKGQTEIISGLDMLKKVNGVRPNSMLLTQFFNAKSDEIISMLEKANTNEFKSTLEFLAKADSRNSTKYRKLIK